MNHDWTISAVAAPVVPPQSSTDTGSNVTAAANVVAVCPSCGETRVFAAVVGNQAVDLSGSCPAKKSSYGG